MFSFIFCYCVQKIHCSNSVSSFQPQTTLSCCCRHVTSILLVFLYFFFNCVSFHFVILMFSLFSHFQSFPFLFHFSFVNLYRLFLHLSILMMLEILSEEKEVCKGIDNEICTLVVFMCFSTSGYILSVSSFYFFFYFFLERHTVLQKVNNSL